MALTALVTGGAQGLGKAICRRLARDGHWSVVVVDINEEKGSQIAREIQGSFIKCDVTDPKQMEAAIARTVEDRGSLDGVVVNAGIVGEQKPLGEYDLEQWKNTIDVNLNGAFYTLKYALAQMATQDSGGSIVSLSSTAGFRGITNLAPYTASKFAIRGLTEMAAVEYGGRGIRVNAVAPTGCETTMVKNWVASSPDPEAMAHVVTDMNALPGFVQPSDVGNAVAFLLSGEARYITGHTLPVDAGALCRVANAQESNSVK